MDNVKKVKRKAKAGEYIELVKERHKTDNVGDILRVSSANEVENYIKVNREDFPNTKEISLAVTVLAYTHDDYVVLEGYEPRTVPIPLTAQLKKKVSELEEINATLLERVENLDAENADRERLARENKELREQVEELTNHHSEMARIIDGLQTEALTQYEKMSELKKENADLRNALHSASKKVGRGTKRGDTETKQRMKLSKEVEELTEQLDQAFSRGNFDHKVKGYLRRKAVKSYEQGLRAEEEIMWLKHMMSQQAEKEE